MPNGIDFVGGFTAGIQPSLQRIVDRRVEEKERTRQESLAAQLRNETLAQQMELAQLADKRMREIAEYQQEQQNLREGMQQGRMLTQAVGTGLKNLGDFVTDWRKQSTAIAKDKTALDQKINERKRMVAKESADAIYKNPYVPEVPVVDDEGNVTARPRTQEEIDRSVMEYNARKAVAKTPPSAQKGRAVSKIEMEAVNKKVDELRGGYDKSWWDTDEGYIKDETSGLLPELDRVTQEFGATIFRDDPGASGPAVARAMQAKYGQTLAALAAANDPAAIKIVAKLREMIEGGVAPTPPQAPKTPPVPLPEIILPPLTQPATKQSSGWAIVR